MEISRDAGSIPAASTQSGCTTRLDSNKARQDNLAGLGRFVHVYRDLRRVASLPNAKSREVSRRGPKSLESGQKSQNHVTRSQRVTRWKWFEIGGLRKPRFFQFGVAGQ